MALVQAARLAFGAKMDGSFVAETSYGTYWLNPRQDNSEWLARLAGDGKSYPFPNEFEAAKFCQADFDKKWLRDTYVPPLVWVEIAGADYWCADTSTGEYYIELKGGGFIWYFVNRNGDSWGRASCASIDDGKAQANHHNRRLVIGEGE